MLRIHAFTIFTIKTPRALAVHALLRPLNRKDTDKCTLTIAYRKVKTKYGIKRNLII